MPQKTDFTEQLKNLFEKNFNEKPSETLLLLASGSDRRYVRMTTKDGKSSIGAYNPNTEENNTFFYFSSLFAKYALPVPEVLATGRNKQIYLLEDLGTQTLYDIIVLEGHSERVKTLLKKTIDQLVRFHWQAGQAIDYSMCFASKEFDKQQILADLLYFKYYFADLLSISYNKQELVDELNRWSDDLANRQPKTFMYRDFQSRNIIVSSENDEVAFIDYQGGMLGLPEYDLASLLWQSRAEFPNEWKTELLNYYFDALKSIPEKTNIKEAAFRKTYLDCVLLRMLQTLGAYGFRGIIQQKGLFLESITPALKQLEYFLNEYPQALHYNELENMLKVLVKPEIQNIFIQNTFPDKAVDKLKIHIYSFSYKKGMPVAENEHGGGFVFDCRGILNPGREEVYKNLTGKDNAVKKYLEQKTKMPEFLKNIFAVVDISVTDYLERGFDSLSISFGCTGGQHRSVYAAEAMKRHLAERFRINAEVIHLEQEPNSIKRR